MKVCSNLVPLSLQISSVEHSGEKKICLRKVGQERPDIQ